MQTNIQNVETRGEIVIYRAKDGRTSLEVNLRQETVWLTQSQMIDLFQRDQSVISRHIHNVFKEGELHPESNMQKMHIAGSDKPVWFMDANRILYRKDGTKRIADNALVALTLMIAESNPKDKDIVVKVLVDLINGGNV